MLNPLTKRYHNGRSYLLKVRINRVGNPCLNGVSCLGIALTVMNVACERRCISGCHLVPSKSIVFGGTRDSRK